MFYVIANTIIRATGGSITPPPEPLFIWNLDTRLWNLETRLWATGTPPTVGEDWTASRLSFNLHEGSGDWVTNRLSFKIA